MASNKHNYYVSSPIGSDYEGVSEEAISRGIDFSKRTHRILSGKGEYENRYDGGSTGFKYLEDTLFSTKDVKFIESDLPMTEVGFIDSMKNREGCVYKVFRFDRSYNIRAFDFIITYTQLSDWQVKTYKAIPVRRQFRGSLLFTGCSIVRDTKTMEELPLKLYAKYESIGDTVGENIDIDGKIDTKGGPAITFTYTYDSNYVYLYVSSISPFRLIPSGDGEFKDISYLENSGSFVGEIKDNVHTIKDPATGVKKTEAYSRNKTLWCDLSIALRDQTTTHTNADSHCVPYTEVANLSGVAYKEKETSFILAPTNDGEQMVIGMAPDSDVGLEIAQDTKPIRFGSRLLSTDMDKVKSYIETLTQKIKTASINTEKTPFTIKTIIRTRGKYNIKGEYFIDDQADSYGQIIIQDVGVYNVISDSFDITEYITDKNTLKSYSANTVAKYKKYINNASDYLSEISDGTVYPHVRKTNKLLEVLSNINFESPDTLDVYSDVAYIRSPVTFEVVSAYAEFGPDENINTDDKIIYICKDGKIRVCGFKDYEMDNVETYDIFGEYLPSEISSQTYVTKVDRAWNGDHYIYCIGTNNGIYALIEGITENEIAVEIKDAFIEKTSTGEFSSGEEVSYLKSDNEYFYIGGKDGSIRIINIDNLASEVLPLHFAYGDGIRYAELISDDTVLFISSLEACTYNLNSDKWNFEGDDYRLQAKFWNPYGSLEKPNVDMIIDENGWENVPAIQVGQFVYALGLRNDTSGYVPIYKRLDTLTGEVITLPEPQHDHKTYRPQLCKEGNLIYVVGGTNPNATNAENPSQLEDLISVFDTTTNKWIEFSKFTLDNNGENRILVSPNFHPVVHKNKMYFIRPKISFMTVNELTGLYTSSEKYDDGMYIVDLSTKACSHISIDLPEEAAKENMVNINIVPAMISDDKITFLAGLRNVTYDNTTDIYTFNGYNLYRIVLDTTNNSVTHTVQLINSKELAANYVGNSANNARSDIFSYYSMSAEYNEALIYCLDCEAIIYARLDVPYAEVHMAYHNLDDYTYYPTVTEGEYIAWNTYGILPGAVTLVHVGNYIAFLGGNSSRVNGYLDLSVISWIPAPRFMERKINVPESAILTANSNAISLISNDKNIVNQVASCKINNTVYLLATKKNLTEYKVSLYKYDLDDPSAKITFVKELSNTLVSEKYVNGFTNFTLTPLGEDVIVISPYIGYDSTGYYDNPVTLFNVFAYKISTRSVAHVINDLAIESDMVGKTIFALEGENKVIFTVNNGPSYAITLTSTGIEYNVSRSINYVGDLETNYTKKDLDYIIPTVRRGKFALAAEPFKEAIVIHKFDTIDGTESVNKNSFLYTIDNSANYNNPQLFLNGNDLYLTKGCKNATLSIDGTNYDNKSFSTEIFKLKFNEAAGLIDGTDNDRMHALLSANTSGLYAPFAISRNNKIIIFGEPRVNFNSNNRNNVDIRLITLESEITDETFVDINTHVTLTGASKSSTNRYKPVMKTIHSNGHELVLVFGGTASPETNVTKTLDVYDTARHIWSRICDLPEFISHVSTKDNVILGGTVEVLKNGTQKAYTTRLEIICKDYDTLSFEIKFKNRPSANYPVYGKWTESGNLTFVIPTNENGSPLKEPTLKIENETVTSIDPIESAVIYNGNYRVIGSFIAKSNVVMVLFNKATCEISFWKNIDNVWTKVTYIVEPNGIDITEKAYVFENSDETFTSIQNGSVFEANAILAYVDPSKINSKGVLVSYITVNENGTVSVTPKPETFAYIPGDDLSAVDSVEISKDGFTYYSKNNVINGEVRRIFPNNNSLGFGCRRLEAKDLVKNDIKTRAIANNHIYTIYDNNTISKINLDTNDKIVLDGTVDLLGEDTVVCSKIIDNSLYVITTSESNKLIKIPLDDLSKSSEKEITANICDKPYFLRDYHKNTFTIVLNTIVDNDILEITYAIVNSSEEFDIEVKTNSSVDSNFDNVLVINENIDLLLKNKTDNRLYLRSANGVIENIVSVPTDVTFCRIDNNTIYGADSSGKIYEIVVKNYEVMFSGYTYSTSGFINDIPEDAIIRNTDIILFNRGYRYIHPSTIDFNHYCYDNIAIDHDINTSFEDKVVSIGVNNEDSESYVIYTSEKATHIVETRKVVVDVNNDPIKNIPIGSKYTMFVDKIGGTLHLCIADPNTGKIYNINASTGVSTITETELSGNTKINAIKINCNKNTYLLHLGKCVLYNTNTSTAVTKDFAVSNNITIDLILKTDPYFKYIRALFKDTNDDNGYYKYGIFDGNHFDIRSSATTDIPTEYNKIEYISDDSIFISNDAENVIEVKISKNGSTAEVVRFIPDYYKYFDTVADKPLIKFTGNVVSGNILKVNDFKIDDVLFFEHSAIYKNKKYTDIFDGTILNVLKYKDKYLVVTTVGTEADTLIICDFENSKFKTIDSDSVRYLSDDRIVVSIETEGYKDVLTGVTHFGQILSIGETDTKILTIDSTDDVVKIDMDDDTLTLSELDITENIESYGLDTYNMIPVKTGSNTVTLYPKESSGSNQTAIFIASKTYGTPSISVESSSTVGTNYIIFKLADYTFVVNKTTEKCFVVATGINGLRKIVSNNSKELSFDLSDIEKEMFKRIPSGVYYGSNNRICVSNCGEDIYFNPMKNISEYYNRYIGVSSNGNVYDVEVPIKDYEISSVGITMMSDLYNSALVRAEGNVLATPFMVYKSNNKNIVAHIPIVTRLNTAKFVKDYDTTEDLSTGEIYAFLPSTLNGTLVRDDASFYRGENVVSIINNSTIKVLVDGLWHIYSKSDNSIPLIGTILPIVMAYGSRIDSTGSEEHRYYAFIDNTGNVSTFDKELKTFVDIAGNVTVKVPFFSTQAMILPSTATEENSQAVEVWAYSDQNPYTDDTSEGGFVTDFAKINNNMLK